MPEVPALPGAPAAPPAPPGAGAGSAPGQPPFGSSPVSQPTANRGQEAAGLSRLAVVVRLLEDILPMVGVGSTPGKDVLKALTSLSKHVPPDSVSPGVQASTMQRLLQQQQQASPQIAAMRAMTPAPAAPPAAA